MHAFVQVAVRRLTKQGLARGFSTWQQWHLDKQRRKRLLLHASANLGKPGLLSAFAWWHGDWETTSRDAEAAALRSELELRLEMEMAERAAALEELEHVRCRGSHSACILPCACIQS